MFTGVNCRAGFFADPCRAAPEIVPAALESSPSPSESIVTAPPVMVKPCGLSPEMLMPSSPDVIVDSVHTLADSLHVSPARLSAYYEAARRRVACVYSFRPQASSWLAQWIATFS